MTTFLWIQSCILLPAAGAIAIVEYQHQRREGPGRTANLGPSAERFREVLTGNWSMILAAVRWMLLLSLALPAIATWQGELQPAALARPLIFSGGLAAAALVVRRFYRGSGVVALAICSGASMLLLILAQIARFPSSDGGYLVYSFGGSLPHSFDSGAGYLIGCTMVFSSTLARESAVTPPTLFHVPELDRREVNPLYTPLPKESRAQLRLVLVNAGVGMVLAASRTPTALLATAALSLATGLQIWGWRNKQLGLKQVVTVAGASLLLAFLCWCLFSSSDIHLVRYTIGNAVRGFLSIVTTPELMVPKVVDLAPRALTGAICAVVLGAAIAILKRPPGHLCTIIGHAPVWGWLLLSGLATSVVVSFLGGGSAIAAALAITVASAALLMWLERSEFVGL